MNQEREVLNPTGKRYLISKPSQRMVRGLEERCKHLRHSCCFNRKNNLGGQWNLKFQYTISLQLSKPKTLAVTMMKTMPPELGISLGTSFTLYYQLHYKLFSDIQLIVILLHVFIAPNQSTEFLNNQISSAITILFISIANISLNQSHIIVIHLKP